MDMYSASYIDWQRTTWPLWANIRWYVAFYLKVFAPDPIVLILLLGSIAWIAISANRRLLPYALVFAAFFVSKPLNLRAAPHHTLLWLPCVAVLCAFPAAKLYEVLAGRAAMHPRWRMGAVGATAALLAAVALLLTNGPRAAAAEAVATEVRLGHISEATDWIQYRTPPGSTVAVGYSCFNPDVFYLWMRFKEVPVPAGAFDGRRFVIWWGQRRELRGLAGYACVGRMETDSLSVRDSNETVDVFHDAAFQRVAAFGSGESEVDLFRFDFRAAAAPGH